MKIALYTRKGSQIDNPKLSYLEQRLRDLNDDIFYCSKDDIPSSLEDTDLVLSLGGDGTFLEAVAFLKDRQKPIAGINFGKLGFLTTAKIDDGDNKWIEDLAKGSYNIENRLLLQAEGDSLPSNLHPYCLNEFSLLRQKSIMNISVSVDGKSLPSYWADGLLVATPTGSTAYALSIGGPVIIPSASCLIICPFAPHNLNIRPIVVSSDSIIDIKFTSNDGTARMAMDNHSCDINSGSTIRLKKAPYYARYVSLRDMSFIDALRDKLMWGEDIRNSI
ncbi:MAG: NAD(+) kinase [Bacteroidales bacterium]|nr:NAD(+) kinase [Bacteroidales bacterium]